MTTEDYEQASVFDWVEIMLYKYPELELLHACPNGGYRPPAVAHTLKRTGVRPGVPDIFLPVARGGYHGLFIEMKRANGGRVSVNQKKWLLALAAQGYRAVVCHGAAEAIRELENYLQGEG